MCCTASYGQYSIRTDVYSYQTTVNGLLPKYYKTFPMDNYLFARSNGISAVKLQIPEIDTTAVYLTDKLKYAVTMKIKSSNGLEQNFTYYWPDTNRETDVVPLSSWELALDSTKVVLGVGENYSTVKYLDDLEPLPATIATAIETEALGLNATGDTEILINFTIMGGVMGYATSPETDTISTSRSSSSMNGDPFSTRVGIGWEFGEFGETWLEDNGDKYFMVELMPIPSKDDLIDHIMDGFLNPCEWDLPFSAFNHIEFRDWDYLLEEPAETLTEYIIATFPQESLNIPKTGGSWPYDIFENPSSPSSITYAQAESMADGMRNSWNKFDMIPKMAGIGWGSGPYMSDDITIEFEVAIEFSVTYLVED